MVEFLPYFNEQQIPHKPNKILTYNENQKKKRSTKLDKTTSK